MQRRNYCCWLVDTETEWKDQFELNQNELTINCLYTLTPFIY